MEIKNLSNIYQILLMSSLIGLGTIGRYALVSLGVPPNFEIIMVMAFLSVILLRPSLAIFVPLLGMIFSDILLGNSIFVGNEMNRIVLFTYSGFAMISLINIFNRERFQKGLGKMQLKNVGFAAGLGIGFVLIYDVWTNFGWWYLIYPHTAQSLVAVFTAGIPFMVNHLISGIATFVLIALPVTYYTSHKEKLCIPINIRSIQKIPVVVFVIVLIVLSFTGTAMKIPEKSDILWIEQSDQTSVKIVIQGDGWRIEDNIFAYDGDTVFSILKKCSERNGFSFEYTYYEEFDSMLIDSINNDVNGDNGKYWQYYVNEDIPMVGSDKYTVSNGDSILWSFETVSY